MAVEQKTKDVEPAQEQPGGDNGAAKIESLQKDIAAVKGRLSRIKSDLGAGMNGAAFAVLQVREQTTKILLQNALLDKDENGESVLRPNADLDVADVETAIDDLVRFKNELLKSANGPGAHSGFIREIVVQMLHPEIDAVSKSLLAVIEEKQAVAARRADEKE